VYCGDYGHCRFKDLGFIVHADPVAAQALRDLGCIVVRGTLVMW